MAVTNKDIFEQFCSMIRKGATNEEMMKEYGGMAIPVPSYKLNGRDDEIRRRYIEDKADPKVLAREFDLGISQIYRIIKPVREPEFDL